MSEFPEGVIKLASETVKENFKSGEPWSKSIARAMMAGRSACSTPPAAANSRSRQLSRRTAVERTVKRRKKTCPNDPKSDPERQNNAPADTDAAQSEAEAFDTIVAARKAYIDAVAAYNTCLEFVRAEREHRNWLNVDPKYAAMSEAQSAFYRTVQELADAAIRQRAEEKP
ncbi:hypothetical protein [Sinorhizobium medicae]|uniref:hypothetical protein n=1 Tax=Sinorhizobium medicae TaxID=110321 RepID=UPI0027DD817B|nr:hypothetical protein [Sinorhizobium medicae]